MDKANAADLSSGVFTILISVTRTIIIQDPLPFHKFREKRANSDITKETLNCTALTTSLMLLVSSDVLFSDP